MIETNIICDHCGAMAMFELAEGAWIGIGILQGTDESTVSFEHFCSWACVAQWALDKTKDKEKCKSHSR